MFQNLNFFPKNVNLYPTGQNCVILGADVPNKSSLPHVGLFNIIIIFLGKNGVDGKPTTML
jgi:hypothetical protein